MKPKKRTDLTIIKRQGTKLVPIGDIPERLKEAAKGFHSASKSDNTKLAYTSDIRCFRGWCRDEGLDPFPACTCETRRPDHDDDCQGGTSSGLVIAYMTWMADERKLRVSTIDRRLTTISQANKESGFRSPREDPRVRAVLKGIRRTLGVAKQKKAAILLEDLIKMTEKLPDNTRGRRDRTLLVLGFAMAGRRSEIVSLRVEDFKSSEPGIIVTLPRSKTDQEGMGYELGIPRDRSGETCRIIEAWLAALKDDGISSGPAFRRVYTDGSFGEAALRPREVARRVKRALKMAGIPPASYSGHSLRAGFITQASLNGKTLEQIMSQSRHQSVKIMLGYVRRANIFKDSAAGGVAL